MRSDRLMKWQLSLDSIWISMWIQKRIQVIVLVEKWSKKIRDNGGSFAAILTDFLKHLIAFYMICSLQNYMPMVLIWFQ